MTRKKADTSITIVEGDKWCWLLESVEVNISGHLLKLCSHVRSLLHSCRWLVVATYKKQTPVVSSWWWLVVATYKKQAPGVSSCWWLVVATYKRQAPEVSSCWWLVVATYKKQAPGVSGGMWLVVATKLSPWASYCTVGDLQWTHLQGSEVTVQQ